MAPIFSPNPQDYDRDITVMAKPGQVAHRLAVCGSTWRLCRWPSPNHARSLKWGVPWLPQKGKAEKLETREGFDAWLLSWKRKKLRIVSQSWEQPLANNPQGNRDLGPATTGTDSANSWNQLKSGFFPQFQERAQPAPTSWFGSVTPSEEDPLSLSSYCETIKGCCFKLLSSC